MTEISIFTSSGTPYAASLSKLILDSNSGVKLSTYYVGEEPFWTNASFKIGPKNKTLFYAKTRKFIDSLGSVVFRQLLPNNLQGHIAYDPRMSSAVMSKFKSDISVFFWGTIWKNFIFDNSYAQFGKKVLIVNTYPVHFTDDSEYKGDDAKYFNFFDMLIVPTNLMRDYLIDELGIEKDKIYVVPEFILQGPVRGVSQKRWSQNRKKVIFLGNMKNVRQSDRIQDDLLLLRKNGFEVYVQCETGEQKFFKTYPPFSIQQIVEGSLSEYLMNFGFVYYGYNTQGSTRERQSITTRFSLAEYCDLPIILDKGKYSGLIEEFEGICQFIDTADLGHQFQKLNLSSQKKQFLELRQNKLLELILCQ